MCHYSQLNESLDPFNFSGFNSSQLHHKGRGHIYYKTQIDCAILLLLLFLGLLNNLLVTWISFCLGRSPPSYCLGGISSSSVTLPSLALSTLFLSC